MRELSTRLTCVAGYRRSVCDVEELDYLARRINAEPEPDVIEAIAARDALIVVAQRLVRQLHHKDLETLADIIFHAGSWRRVGVLGETPIDVDLLLEQA